MILLIGGSGQTGQRLRSLRDAEILSPSSSELDLRDADQLRYFFKKYNFSAVINSAAFTDVAAAEKNPASCFAINTDAVVQLAHLTAERGIPLVHYSSDYVFDGVSQTPYTEDAPLQSLNVYGQSKARAEVALRNFSHCLVIRTSWVFDRQGKNFFTKLECTLKDTGELRVVSDQLGSPTWAMDLARATFDLLDQNARGFYNFSSTNQASWWQLAQHYFHLRGLSPKIIPVKSDPNSAVKRPLYSVLDISRAQRILKNPCVLRPWQEAINDCFANGAENNLSWNIPEHPRHSEVNAKS